MQGISLKHRGKKGFTLVELLIVLIIIGILAGMLMLAMGASKDKFWATRIMSNMRNIKSSIALYQSDTGSPIPIGYNKELATTGSSLDKYFSNVPKGYFVVRENEDKFYVLFDGLKSDPVFNASSNMWDKLAKMENDIGLSVDKGEAKAYMYLVKK